MRTSHWFLSACGCSPVGSESSLCDPATGICECKMNYNGRNCDRCINGFGNVELGCISCQCNMTGSISKLCDPVSGQCPCKAGVFGLKCDTCLEGYYSFTTNGCIWCGCDINGADSIQCEDPSGQCSCKLNVTGKICNKCAIGHWNLLSGEGCESCNCNETGSTSDLCDELYGQCSCQPGVGGEKCDRCLPGFYGFSETGCKKCDPCKNTGHICDPLSGKCLCPPHTEGEYCQRCTTSSWGYDPLHGCKTCNCDTRGSPSPICDVDNGNCLCLEGYEGRRCDKCRFAHYKFPNCRKCNCRHAGTETPQCTPEGLCQCDDDGQCPCKANVEGVQCELCKEQTFGMALENPKGCFDCFCFGRSATCSQAQMVWSQITMLPREIQFELGDTPLATLHNFLLIPGQTGHVKLGIPYILRQPLYWMLPREFLGEKTRSYNGMLHFHIESPSSKKFPDPLLLQYPLIVLQGNHRLVLVHSPFLPISGGRYSVRLHEDEWRLLENPQVSVTRMMLMIALQNVQYLLIRATEGTDVKISRLRDVSLEYAVPLSPTPASPYVAVGVENCICSNEHKGYSCQDPGRGYYRKFKPKFLESKDLLDLIGFSAPCPCNNRSETCDPESGHCYNCRENTAGAFCELCAKGYFGNPAMSSCKPCGCPLKTNSFSDTCEGDIIGHVCTNCQKGYEGKHCEKCSRGYYGNPMIIGDNCKPCECNPYGSLDRICDRMTGHCHCRIDIEGRDCTKCKKAHHILTEAGCKSCEDKCLTPLLDDMELLVDLVTKSNFSNFVPAPWIPLLTLDNQTHVLQKVILKHRNILEIGRNISENFFTQFDFETVADLMYLRARDMSIRAPPLAFHSNEAKDEAEMLYRNLDKTWKNIFDAVNRLQNNGKEKNMTIKAIAKSINLAEKMLENIKKRMLTDLREEAEREMRKASQVLQAVKTAIMDYLLFDDKSAQVNRLSHILSEFVRLIERKVRRIYEFSSEKIKKGRVREKFINDNILLSAGNSDMTKLTLFNAGEFLGYAETFIANASSILALVEPLQVSLQNVTEQLEYLRGILERLNPRYINKFVIPAKEHADHISKQALYLAELFRGSRMASQFPLQAAKVYQDIIDTIDLAEQIALETHITADRALYAAHPDRHDSLTKQAEFVQTHSRKLHNEAVTHKINVRELQESLEKKKKVLQKIRQHLINGSKAVTAVEKEIDKLPRHIGHKLIDIQEEHQRTKEKLLVAHQNLDEMIQQINEYLYRKLDNLRIGSSPGLYNTTKIIDTAKGTIQQAISRTKIVESRVEKVKGLNNEMQAKMKNLRNKIILARQKASNIRVSLSIDSTGICVRSFKPDIQPSSTNNIVLNYAINTNKNDSLLLFLASSVTMSHDREPDDFMIVEMVDRQIRFLWNAGGGTQVIEHSMKIKTNDEQFLKNQFWYKIEVNRFGNIATLSVKPTTDGLKNDPFEVTSASPAGFSKMDLDPDSFFYVGGTPKGYRVPRELKARNFAGCLYEVVLDEKKVGLWNFATSQGCDGCKEGAVQEVDLGAYSFKGDGYAILPQIKRYKEHSYLVTLRFRTFDEDCLMFFAPNLENGDFVALELREGHVVYQFSLGGTRSVLKTTQKYNTGSWIRLAAVRENLQGQLSVEEEFLEGQLPSGTSTEMDLQRSFLYFGGVPPNFTTTMWSGITFQKYLGCMKDLQIDSTPLDLLQNDSYGVEASCRDTPLRIISFRGHGYLEMAGHTLLVESDFGLSFQTTQNSAVLLLSTFNAGMNPESPKQDFYSVAIIDRRLEARFSSGNREAVINSSVLVNDGLFHTVTMLKKHRKLIMRVDDIEVGSGRLPEGSENVDAPIDRGLFFGGFREGIFYNSMISTNVPLIGTIKDAIFNNKLLHFNEPVSFKGAGIGRSEKDWFGMEKPYTGVTQPLERCAEMASYTLEKHAVKFGDQPYSHAKLNIGRKDFVYDFNVTFYVRTYYRNGLIILVKNGRGVSHFSVMLRRGKVIMNVYDRKNKRVMSPKAINDGNWHNIMVNKTGRHMVLRIDSQEKGVNLKVRRKIALRAPLYIGGVPKDMPAIDKVILESFKGCIRNFYLNDIHMDIASGELHHVGQCFSTIEPGAYFNGDAYAVYKPKSKFNLGKKMDIQMEFKTTRLNGVLLSLTEASGVPSLALEIFNGNVMISVDLNDGKPFGAVKTFISKYEMCDGQWHMITAQYTHKTITLKVDMYDISYGLSENIPVKLNTSTPLYIGGIPEGAPKGALHVLDSFTGCLRNLAVDDKRVDWISMDARHNVLTNSCPTF